MKEQFSGLMLRIHLGEEDRFQNRPLYEVIMDKCRDAGVRCAVVYRGIEGYGSSTRIRSGGGWLSSKDAPIVVSIVDREEKTKLLLREIEELVPEGLIATSHVDVIHYTAE